jgi:hypothetical protein
MVYKFNISQEELAKELDITLEKLIETIDFFDSDPDDEWELLENKHFVFINQNLKIRKFSEIGALDIAFYFDCYGKKGIWWQIKEFVTKKTDRLRHSLVQKIIQEELYEPDNKIVQVNGKNFIHKQCLRRILETNGQTVNKALQELRQSKHPLEIEVDYVEREFPDPKKKGQGQQLWFSGKGSFYVSKKISETLKDKGRKNKCKVVSEEIEKALKLLDGKTQKLADQISKVKRKAKTRDKMCQITYKKPDAANSLMQLSAHHLYSVNEYPHLATVLENLITIDAQIHQEFHTSWMGGYSTPCTVQDFIDFVTERYPDSPNEELIAKLYQSKKILKIE